MNNEHIFDLLKNLRLQAMKDQEWGLLRAIEKAENAALEEICGVDLMRDISTNKIPTTEHVTRLPKVYHL